MELVTARDKAVSLHVEVLGGNIENKSLFTYDRGHLYIPKVNYWK